MEELRPPQLHSQIHLGSSPPELAALQRRSQPYRRPWLMRAEDNGALEFNSPSMDSWANIRLVVSWICWCTVYTIVFSRSARGIVGPSCPILAMPNTRHQHVHFTSRKKMTVAEKGTAGGHCGCLVAGENLACVASPQKPPPNDDSTPVASSVATNFTFL